MASLDPAVATQKAVFKALTAAGALPALGDPANPFVPQVYDRVPIGAQPPYAVVGEDHVLDASAEGYDGSEVVVNVHVFSRAVGMLEAKTIAAAVRAALSTELDLTADGFVCVVHLFRNTQYLRDADGVTTHAIVSVQYQVEPAA